jgi:hypothetical protein
LMERAARTECQHQDNAEQNGRPAPAVLMHG